jgi:ketosteroid isomerase-like protein
MSRRNLAVVEEAFEAYYRGDVGRAAELADPDIVVNQPAEMPETETFHGPQGFIEAIEKWEGEWDDFRVERLSTRAVGDHVLTTVRQRGRGKGSGAEVEGVFTFVFTLRAGKLVRWQMFADERQALEAVRLRQARASSARQPRRASAFASR